MSKVMYAGLIDFQYENRLACFQTGNDTKPQFADELVMFMVAEGQSISEALSSFIAANKPECVNQWKKTIFTSFTSENPPRLTGTMH